MNVLVWSLKGSGTHYGGPGTAIYRLYKGMKCLSSVELAHGSQSQKENEAYKKIHKIHPVKDDGWVEKVKFIIYGILWLLYNHEKYDIIVGVTSYHHTVVPLAIAQLLGTETVLRVGNHKADLASKKGLKKLLFLPEQRRLILKYQSSAVIAISKSIVDELKSYGIPDEKIKYIPNGVNTDRFKTKETNKCRWIESGNSKEVKMVFVGSLVPRKRPDILVRAVQILNDYENIGLTLSMVGPKSNKKYVKKIERYADKNGVKKKIKILGFKKSISYYYRRSDFFVLPSKNEGMPNSLLEAMSSGLICLATKTSGCVELINHGRNGFFVEPNPQKISKRVITLVNTPKTASKVAKRARRYIVKNYSHKKIRQKHCSLLDGINNFRDE